MEGHSLGFIYGVTHPRFPGYVKVGKARSAAQRLRQYNTGCPHRAYELAFAIVVPNMHEAEQRAFRRLRGSRVEGTEWFAIHPQDAFNLLTSLSEEGI